MHMLQERQIKDDPRDFNGRLYLEFTAVQFTARQT